MKLNATFIIILSLFIIACKFSNRQALVQGFNGTNDTLNKINSYLENLEKTKNFSGGLLIVKNGVRIFSKGFGFADKEKGIKFSSSTPASIGSITKAFTAAGIMKLVEQKKISLTDSLKIFFNNIPADKAGITIQQLLTHSSGFVEFLKADGGDFEIIKTDQFLQRAFESPLAFKPGSKAIYTNVGMSILGIIIEKISGVDYETYLKQNLFNPLKMNIGYYANATANDSIAVGYQNGKRWGTHPEHYKIAGGGPYWNLKANGGLEASLNDMEIFANAITNHTVLSEPAINEMFIPHIMEEGYNGNSYFGYGCNISKSRRGTKVIDNGGSNGIYFARMVRLPQEGLVFYMVTNESSINTNNVLPNISQLYFQGKITQDATSLNKPEQPPVAKQIIEILNKPGVTDLGTELSKENIKVDDDMILLNIGEELISNKQYDKAQILYEYYTKAFPNIVVCWNDLADIYIIKGRNHDAKKCYETALKLRPGNPRAIKGLKKL